MPKQTRSQAIGREGEKWFFGQLPSTWIAQRPSEDIGVDALVVICDDGPLNGLEFRVQVKSSDTWSIKDEEIVVKKFNRESLRDLLIGFTPAMIVLYESKNKRGVCWWLNQVVGKNISLLSKKQKTVTFRVPMARFISENIWEQIGNEIKGITTALGRRVSLSGRALPILQFVKAASETLRHLDFVETNHAIDREKTQEQIDILDAMEISCHRDIVRAVRQLNENLNDAGCKVEGLEQFANEYVRKCSEFIQDFESVVENFDLDKFQSVTFDEKSMSYRRKGFLRSIMDVQAQITTLGLGLAIDENEAHVAEKSS